jgi:SRSO17 transposase
MAEPDADWLQRLDAYAARFRDAFRRRDQARWAAVYLQGLLRDGERKTIGGLARRVTLPPDLAVEDAAQALQNFVNQSPWDDVAVGRRRRALLAERFADPDGAFVADELAFVKQGRYSVGVQRQYSGTLGRKTNCQIAVILYHVGAAGCSPLGLRLYLPRGWLADETRLHGAGVPEERRRPQSKAAVALDLLDEARADGWSARLTTGPAGFGGDRAFREGLAARGLMYLLETPDDAPAADGEAVWPRTDAGRAAVGNVPAAEAAAARDYAEGARRAARATAAVLSAELGMDHFEGRSWRGFHHHAGLVLLAHGFRLLHDGPAAPVSVG